MSDFWDSARDRILRFGFWRMYGTGDGPHPDSADLYDEQAVAELGRGACVRSGNCCLAAPCPVAIGRGEQYGQRCSYLRGDTAGRHACQLALDGDPELMAVVGIGAGCSNPGNLDRLRAGRQQSADRAQPELSGALGLGGRRRGSQ